MNLNYAKKFFTFDYYVNILSGKQNYRPLVAILAISLILTISPSIYIFRNIYPLVRNLEKTALTLVDQIYPEELRINITGGTASTNVTEPYYITANQEYVANLFLPKKTKKIPVASSKIRLLAIDTKAAADDFENYQSLTLLTKNSLVAYNNRKIEVYPLREISSLTISKKLIVEKIKEVNRKNKIVNILSIILFVAPFLMILGSFLFFLICLTFTTLFVFIMIKINQLNIGFRHTFRYTVAFAFIPTVIQNLLSLIPHFPSELKSALFLVDILILGLCYYGITQLKIKKSYEKNK